MFGLSSNVKDAINSKVDGLFDRIARDLIWFGLASLFIQSMGNRSPNEPERDVLKSILRSSQGYLDALKNRTRSNITERLDGLAREADLRKEDMRESDIQDAISEEMKKARSHILTIAEGEATKVRNLGTGMDITRVASNLGDEDPTVFFVMVHDNVTCSECKRLHTTNGVTPRLWKFSELKQGYHKRGEENASAFGLHPHCRCTLTYLPHGWGFNKHGHVTYVRENFDAYRYQKK